MNTVGVEEVDTTTLDELVATFGLTHVDLVKIDVEGSETRVLAGATRTLGQLRPTLLLEVQDQSLRALGSSRAELLADLAAWDYEVLPFSEVDGLPTRARIATIDDLNVVAVPVERRP